MVAAALIFPQGHRTIFSSPSGQASEWEPPCSAKAHPNTTVIDDVTTVPGVWQAAFIESRRELRYAEELAVKGIAVYCPTEPRRVKAKGVWCDSRSPLFQNYVFYAAQVDGDGWAREIDIASRVRGYQSGLHIGNQRRFVSELRGVQLAIQSDPTATLYRDIPIGTAVVVRPPHKLKGFKATVIQHDPLKCRVVLMVLGSGAITFELDADLVEPDSNPL